MSSWWDDAFAGVTQALAPGQTPAALALLQRVDVVRLLADDNYGKLSRQAQDDIAATAAALASRISREGAYQGASTQVAAFERRVTDAIFGKGPSSKPSSPSSPSTPSTPSSPSSPASPSTPSFPVVAMRAELPSWVTWATIAVAAGGLWWVYRRGR